MKATLAYVRSKQNIADIMTRAERLKSLTEAMSISWEPEDSRNEAIIEVQRKILARAERHKQLEQQAQMFIDAAEKTKSKPGKRKNAKKRSFFGFIKHHWNLNKSVTKN